ncbi:Pol31 [Symbiodinium natans]|uniref:Pol31 protein n=1 Tax=Symbiodinium natans TaxID=878477 RepID=A0A812IXB2_9DINO|nr:Pol31 [Symbiodinium natans]
MAPLAKKARTTASQGNISSFFGPKKAVEASQTNEKPELKAEGSTELQKPPGQVCTPTKDEHHKVCPSVPTPEKSSPPVPRRVATACSGRFQSGFARDKASSWQQYNNLYRLRLKQLAGACRDEAKRKWSSVAGKGFLQDLSEFRGGSDMEIVVVGVLFKELHNRPNVIDQYKGSKALLNGAKEEVSVLYSEKDTLWLEDCVMRVQLEVDQEVLAVLATGFVVAVRGVATQAGTLRVHGVQLPRMPVMPPISSSETSGPFIAFVSGLGFGDQKNMEARAKALDFLSGKVPGPAVQHVVVCGGCFAQSCQVDSDVKAVAAALRQMDTEMLPLVEAKSVQVMPSYGEPTNASMPQLPFHRSLFQLSSSSGFRPVGNPCSLNFDGLEVLGHSGEPVKDLLRCTQLQPMQALQKCLEARHLAPTAPDTLLTQPFEDSDPFVLESVPHILFSGGHDKAVQAWHPCARGGGGTQCICVPAFHLQPAVVLVNLRDPRDVRVEEFSVTQK